MSILSLSPGPFAFFPLQLWSYSMWTPRRAGADSGAGQPTQATMWSGLSQWERGTERASGRQSAEASWKGEEGGRRRGGGEVQTRRKTRDERGEIEGKWSSFFFLFTFSRDLCFSKGRELNKWSHQGSVRTLQRLNESERAPGSHDCSCL